MVFNPFFQVFSNWMPSEKTTLRNQARVLIIIRVHQIYLVLNWQFIVGKLQVVSVEGIDCTSMAFVRLGLLFAHGKKQSHIW